MNREKLRALLTDGLDALDIPLPPHAVDQLLEYQALLERWNAAYNLTAVRDPAGMITRHLLDSLAILPHVRGKTLVDVGTGPGLPGIPLALADPARDVLLVDANGKKVRFLREAIRALGLTHVRAAQARVETLEGSFDCVTARAFASLADMLGWGGHLLAPGGVWLAMKGQVPQAEIDALPPGFAVQAVHALAVPGLPAERHLVVLARAAGEGLPDRDANLASFRRR